MKRANCTNPDSQPQPKQYPETFPDGSLYQLTDHDDGTIEVKLITGERFIGRPLTVTQKIAEANVHTKRWAQQQRAQGQQQTQPQQQAQAQPPQQQQPMNGNEVPQNTFGEWAADHSAQALGFTDHNEMIQWGLEMTAFKEEQESHRNAADFLTRNPEYPNTPKKEQALIGTIEKMGWQYTPDTMAAAHAYAVQQGFYRPLTLEQQQEAV